MNNDEYFLAISAELRNIRNKTDVSDVANSTGINKDTIYRYEKNAKGCKLYILVLLLCYYNEPIHIFFKNVDDRMQKNKSLII